MGGLTDKLAGKTKQVTGIASDDKKLEGEGKGQEAKGDLKQKADNLLEKVSEVTNDLKKKINEK